MLIVLGKRWLLLIHDRLGLVREHSTKNLLLMISASLDHRIEGLIVIKEPRLVVHIIQLSRVQAAIGGKVHNRCLKLLLSFLHAMGGES